MLYVYMLDLVISNPYNGRMYIANVAKLGGWEFFHYRLYLFALVGRVGYYIVDHYGARTTANDAQIVFIHGLGFSAYSFTVGYLFTAAPGEGFFPFGLAALVFGLHLFGVNHQLRHWHRDVFDRYLRWMLASSIIVGWVVGVSFDLGKGTLATATALLGGAILINVMTEELPGPQAGKIVPFLGGIACFTLITALIRTLPRI